MAIMIDSNGNGTDGSKWVLEERLDAAIIEEGVQRAMANDMEHAYAAERARANRAEADVKTCQDVYTAARMVVQTWRDTSVNTGPLAPLLERLEKAVGL